MKKIYYLTMMSIVLAGGGLLAWSKTRDASSPIVATVTTDRVSTYGTLGDIDRDATLIIKGEVVAVEAARDIRTARDANNNVVPSKYPELYTDVRVKVVRAWKGTAELVNDEIIVRQIGGILGNVTMNSEDRLLKNGERVVLFLTPSLVRDALPEGDGWVILGEGAGHITLRENNASFETIDPFATSFNGKAATNFEQALDAFYKK